MEDRINTVDLFKDANSDSVCEKCKSATEECFSLMSENRILKEVIKAGKKDVVIENHETLASENNHLKDLVKFYKKEKKNDEHAMFEIIKHCDNLQEEFEKLQKEKEELILSYEAAKQILIGEKRELKVKITTLLDLKAYLEGIEKVYQSAGFRQSNKIKDLRSVQDMLINACDFFDHNYGTLNGKYWKCSLCHHNCHASDIYKHCLVCIKVHDTRNI